MKGEPPGSTEMNKHSKKLPKNERKQSSARGGSPTPKVAERHAIGIAAYYKDENPGGLGVGRQVDDEFMRRMEIAAKRYDLLANNLSREAQVNFCIKQLDAACASRTDGTIADDDWMLAIFHIYWLDTRGLMVRDEYNGIVIAYASEVA